MIDVEFKIFQTKRLFDFVFVWKHHSYYNGVEWSHETFIFFIESYVFRWDVKKTS